MISMYIASVRPLFHARMGAYTLRAQGVWANLGTMLPLHLRSSRLIHAGRLSVASETLRTDS
jgi:hypothetical protein